MRKPFTRDTGVIPVEIVSTGTLMTTDGRSVFAASEYGSNTPADGRPVRTVTTTDPQDGTAIVPISLYDAGTLVTPDGRPVYAVSGTAEQSFMLDAASNTVTTSDYSGPPEGAFTSSISPKYLFNSSGNLVQQNRLFRTQTQASVINLPDANGSDTGHGFAPTGIAIDSDGNYIVGNGGVGNETETPDSQCGIVKLSPSGVNLGEINVRALYNLGTQGTLQGLDIDPRDGSYWVGCGGAGVKHVSTAGAALPGAFTPASGDGNGIAIDTLRNRILVLHYVGTTTGQIDIYDLGAVGDTPTFVASQNITGVPACDHLSYDAARDYVWVTWGSNGAAGSATAFKGSDFSAVGTAVFPNATSIEGLRIVNGQFIVCHDGYFHGFTSGATPALNQLQFYPAALGKANVNWPVEYHPTTHALLGYRFEPQFIRLNDFSIDHESANWTKTNVSVTANNAVSPTGATDANTITASSGTAVHEIQRPSGTSVSAGALVIANDMLKAGTYRYAWCGDRGDSSIHSATFDLQAGTVVGSSNCAASIRDLGNGWYRCTRTYTHATATSIGGNISFGTSSHTLDHPSVAAAGTETILAYLHELGVGEYPTTPVFISSTASSETRAADTATLDVSSTLGATANTFVCEGRTALGSSATGKQVFFQIDDGSANNRYRLERDTSKHLKFIVSVSGTDQCALDLGVVADDTDFKVAARAVANDFAASLNGGTVVTDTTGSLPTVTTLRPGHSFSGEQWGGWVKSFKIIPSATNDSDLATLSLPSS